MAYVCMITLYAFFVEENLMDFKLNKMLLLF